MKSLLDKVEMLVNADAEKISKLAYKSPEKAWSLLEEFLSDIESLGYMELDFISEYQDERGNKVLLTLYKMYSNIPSDNHEEESEEEEEEYRIITLFNGKNAKYYIYSGFIEVTEE